MDKQEHNLASQQADTSQKEVTAAKQEAVVEKEKPKEEEDELLSGFQENVNLNLTGGDEAEGDEDPEEMKKIKEEYEKFMKDMQGDMDENGGMNLDGMAGALGELLKGLAGEEGGEGLGQDMGKKFADMFKSFESGEDMESAAEKLLGEFMDKSLLEEPLKETDQNYQQYFKKQEEASKEVDPRYRKQHEVVQKILHVLEVEPENKNKLIGLFEEMQQYGNPPETIAPVSGFF